MNRFQVAALAAIGVIILAATGHADEPNPPPQRPALVRVDWQVPQQLPPRFRNHCAVENFTGRPYCSDHCGIDYQFYFCGPGSFGCCHLGHGYCDWSGLLRCHP